MKTADILADTYKQLAKIEQEEKVETQKKLVPEKQQQDSKLEDSLKQVSNKISDLVFSQAAEEQVTNTDLNAPIAGVSAQPSASQSSEKIANVADVVEPVKETDSKTVESTEPKKSIGIAESQKPLGTQKLSQEISTYIYKINSASDEVDLNENKPTETTPKTEEIPKTATETALKTEEITKAATENALKTVGKDMTSKSALKKAGKVKNKDEVDDDDDDIHSRSKHFGPHKSNKKSSKHPNKNGKEKKPKSKKPVFPLGTNPHQKKPAHNEPKEHLPKYKTSHKKVTKHSPQRDHHKINIDRLLGKRHL